MCDYNPLRKHYKTSNDRHDALEQILINLSGYKDHRGLHVNLPGIGQLSDICQQMENELSENEYIGFPNNMKGFFGKSNP